MASSTPHSEDGSRVVALHSVSLAELEAHFPELTSLCGSGLENCLKGRTSQDLQGANEVAAFTLSSESPLEAVSMDAKVPVDPSLSLFPQLPVSGPPPHA